MTAKQRPLCDCDEGCACQVKRACPAEGGDADGQKLARELRAGGGLGTGGP